MWKCIYERWTGWVCQGMGDKNWKGRESKRGGGGIQDPREKGWTGVQGTRASRWSHTHQSPIHSTTRWHDGLWIQLETKMDARQTAVVSTSGWQGVRVRDTSMHHCTWRVWLESIELTKQRQCLKTTTMSQKKSDSYIEGAFSERQNAVVLVIEKHTECHCGCRAADDDDAILSTREDHTTWTRRRHVSVWTRTRHVSVRMRGREGRNDREDGGIRGKKGREGRRGGGKWGKDSVKEALVV